VQKTARKYPKISENAGIEKTLAGLESQIADVKIDEKSAENPAISVS
jgi:hypothetical protein